MLEKLVHTGRQIPKHQVCVTFECPDDLPVTTLDAKTIPGWSDEDYRVGRRAGDAWLLAAQTAILLVPSVVFEVERNALIDPAPRHGSHPDRGHRRDSLGRSPLPSLNVPGTNRRITGAPHDSGCSPPAASCTKKTTPSRAATCAIRLGLYSMSDAHRRT